MSAAQIIRPAASLESSRGATALGFPWYLLRTKVGREQHVHNTLFELGILTYLPLIRSRRFGRKFFNRPLFPSYLFASLDLETTSVLVNSQRLAVPVLFGGQPAIVPSEVIEEIRQRQDETGLIQLVKFASGAKVRVVDGPLKGIEALFDCELSGDERVRILYRQMRIDVNAGDLVPVN